MGRLVRAGVCKHLYIRVVQGYAPIGNTSLWLQSKVKLILTIILSTSITLCVHPSKHASVSLCVHVCIWVCDMCLHVSVHNIMCSAQPEVAAVLDWYGPEADPAYWQRGREEVAGLQVACEAHNVHVGEKFLGYPPDIFWGILDPLILIIISSL